MKRILIVLLILMVCCGCSANPADLEKSLQRQIDDLLAQEAACLADNHKTLFSYYTEPNVGRKTSTMTSNVLVLNGVKIVMNLDISTVMNSKYYPDVPVLRKPTGNELVYLSGKYEDCTKTGYEYALSVYLLDSGKYYVDLQTHAVNFYSTLDYVMIDDVVLQMLKISRTVEVNEAEIISYYSSKPADEHQREKVDLFKEEFAENGRLDELIGITESGEFTDEEPEIDEPVEELPEVWTDELVPEE